MSPPHWDAVTYDRVSDPQVRWAEAVIDRLELTGEEWVLDAGCGSGRVTEMLLEKAAGVVGVDSDPEMVAHARERLRGRVKILQRDITWMTFDEPFDAIFSNAVLHWVPSHEQAFARCAEALRPGGRISFQCGAAGNIAGVLEQAGITEHPWNYATPEETEARLLDAGFEQVSCWLEPAPTVPEDPRAFLAAVVFRTFGDPEALAARVTQTELDYVRLNITAVRS